MKILNLYAGIGGNRKLWGNEHEITAVEIEPDVAKVYKTFYPNDTVLIEDAHDYLLKHYKEYDFIWSSPPCPSHSDIRRAGTHRGQYSAIYPEMGLYQEIILMKYYHRRGSFYVIENVKPYYDPLIPPTSAQHRHYFWANFPISIFEVKDKRKHSDIVGSSVIYGVDLSSHTLKNKRKSLRDMVDPELGLHILNEALQIKPVQPQQFLF